MGIGTFIFVNFYQKKNLHSLTLKLVPTFCTLYKFTPVNIFGVGIGFGWDLRFEKITLVNLC